jgi:hypothetical protein
MKAYVQWKFSSTILDLGTGQRQVISFTLPALYPREIAPTVRCIGSRVGPNAGLGAVAKRRSAYLCRESNRMRPTRRYINTAMSAPTPPKYASENGKCPA